MEHNQFWKHDELVRRERKSWVHIVGRAPQIAGAAAIPTTSSNPFLPTSKTTTIRPSRAAKSESRTPLCRQSLCPRPEPVEARRIG